MNEHSVYNVLRLYFVMELVAVLISATLWQCFHINHGRPVTAGLSLCGETTTSTKGSYYNHILVQLCCDLSCLIIK